VPQASKRAIRFVRSLLPDGEARRVGSGDFRAVGADRAATLPPADVAVLRSAGVLVGNADTCRAGPDARSWLRRQIVGGEPYAGQHREEITAADGRRIDLSESPLARLAAAGADGDRPFLAPHQVEAGERFRRLFERASLRQRVTVAYDPARGKGGSPRSEVSDMAADARKALAAIIEALPAECAGVVFDVCGLEKGLQQVEGERGWPRRSAKLVLRIGLDQLARHYHLTPLAVGRAGTPNRAWMEQGARPEMFAEE
jgi:hypothetical protein